NGVCQEPATCDSAQCLKQTEDKCGCDSTCQEGQTCENGSCKGCPTGYTSFYLKQESAEKVSAGLLDSAVTLACSDVYNQYMGTMQTQTMGCCKAPKEIKEKTKEQRSLNTTVAGVEIACVTLTTTTYACECPEDKPTTCGDKCCSGPCNDSGDGCKYMGTCNGKEMECLATVWELADADENPPEFHCFEDFYGGYHCATMMYQGDYHQCDCTNPGTFWHIGECKGCCSYNGPDGTEQGECASSDCSHHGLHVCSWVK
ncbi:MAG: hypothetical protein IJC30_04560, partial [Alphaproteobacteria bacterium]|nr:hypothetical protein [Alphaproteobacteria bacterium]